MGESKYIEQLNKIIDETITCTPENLPSLKNSTKKCLVDINKYLNDNNELDPKNPDENIFSYYLIRQLRIKYQLEINKYISDDTKIISIGKIMCEFIFWLINESKIISFQQLIKFLQDIVETIPLSGLEEIFNLISDFLKNLDNSLIETKKLDVLLLQNIFLRRTNNNLDDKLRGKIFLLFCSLFSISDKSGVNLKGKYSQNKIDEELSNYSNDNSDTIINDEDAKMDVVIDEKNEEKKDDKIANDFTGVSNNIKDAKNNTEDKMIIDDESKTDEIQKEDKKDINNSKKEEKEKEKEEVKENKVEEDKNNNEKDINLSKELNEKNIFYEQFWIIEKFLINPFMVCNLFIIYIIIKYFSLQLFNEQEISKEKFIYINKPNYKLEQKYSNNNDKKNNNNNLQNTKTSHIDIFLSNIESIIKYFEEHNEQNSYHFQKFENWYSIEKYHKLFHQYELFYEQIRQPLFRKKFIIQLLVVLNSFITPINTFQKEKFNFSQSQKERIINLIRVCTLYLYKKYNIYINDLFQNEKNWSKWKKQNCYDIVKPETNNTETLKKENPETARKEKPDIAKKNSNAENGKKDNSEIVEEATKDDVINGKIKESKEKLKNYKFYFKNENSNYINDINNLKETKIKDILFSASIEGLNSEVPFFGTYLDEIYKELDPEEEDEESKSNINKDTNKERIFNNDQSFTWKFLRLLSEGDLNKINIEEVYKLLSISEEFYKQFGLKDGDTKLNFKPIPPPPKIELKPKEEITLPKELLNNNNDMNIENKDNEIDDKNKPVINLQNIIRNDNNNNVIKNLSSDNANITEIKVQTKKEESKEKIRLPIDIKNESSKKDETPIINISTTNKDISLIKLISKESIQVNKNQNQIEKDISLIKLISKDSKLINKNLIKNNESKEKNSDKNDNIINNNDSNHNNKDKENREKQINNNSNNNKVNDNKDKEVIRDNNNIKKNDNNENIKSNSNNNTNNNENFKLNEKKLEVKKEINDKEIKKEENNNIQNQISNSNNKEKEINNKENKEIKGNKDIKENNYMTKMSDSTIPAGIINISKDKSDIPHKTSFAMKDIKGENSNIKNNNKDNNNINNTSNNNIKDLKDNNANINNKNIQNIKNDKTNYHNSNSKNIPSNNNSKNSDAKNKSIPNNISDGNKINYPSNSIRKQTSNASNNRSQTSSRYDYGYDKNYEGNRKNNQDNKNQYYNNHDMYNDKSNNRYKPYDSNYNNNYGYNNNRYKDKHLMNNKRYNDDKYDYYNNNKKKKYDK